MTITRVFAKPWQALPPADDSVIEALSAVPATVPFMGVAVIVSGGVTFAVYVTELPLWVTGLPLPDHVHDVAAVPVHVALMLTEPPVDGIPALVGEIEQLVGAPVGGGEVVPPSVQLKRLFTIDQPPAHCARSTCVVPAFAAGAAAHSSNAQPADVSAGFRASLRDRRMWDSPS